jgi:hypothetical protein
VDENGEESEKERIDRELLELLNELRVALPGVQVLFAFLLTLPFTQRYEQVTDFERDVYFGTLLATTVATILLIAPSAQHRLLFRMREKERLLWRANHLAIAGFACLVVAMLGVVLLITDVLFGSAETVVTTTIIGGLFVFFWFAQPLRRRLKSTS